MSSIQISYKDSSSILTEAKGFMSEYDYTLNPYSGCAFGCTYCYAAFFSRSRELKDNWGNWVQVKQNALQLLQKFRKNTLDGKTIYMSSVTDPYQPIEKTAGITRALLEELCTYHQPRLVIQTRSPLAARDIDLFSRFSQLQVNMTITTDSEKVRKVFEPTCPSNKVRLETIKTINNAGIMTCITMTPLLPVENTDEFVRMLLDTGTTKFTIQPFHSDKGKFVGRTREHASKLINDLEWTEEKYRSVFETLRKHIPQLAVGQEGFKPI